MAIQNYKTLIGTSQQYGRTSKLFYRNVEMFYLILFLDVKLDTLIQYMTFRCRYFLRFCSNSQQRIRIGKRINDIQFSDLNIVHLSLSESKQ